MNRTLEMKSGSLTVDPSISRPVLAASSVLTLNNLRASRTCTSVTSGVQDMRAKLSLKRTIASS
jgi:hypothetical protein